MEDVKRIASVAYEKLTEEDKKKMESDFRSMDKNGDGKIDIHDFTEYPLRFLGLLDRNDDGCLEFEEFKILKYIEQSGRPFCAACKDFISANFFTCTECRLSQNSGSYDLCVRCYREGKFDHDPDHHSQFKDNYTLLLKFQRLVSAPPQQVSAPLQEGPSQDTIPENPSDSSKSNPSGDKSRRPSCLARLKKIMKKRSRIIAEVVGAAIGSAITAVCSNCIGNDDDDKDYNTAAANPPPPARNP